jgi:drug/metabolite transporter (DMT)-like permease
MNKSNPSPPANASAAPWIALMPVVFIFLWSTGWLGAKYGLPYAEPFHFLAVRFLIAAILLTLFAFISRAPLPDTRRQIWDALLVGALLHGVYLAGVFWSVAQGFPVGISALINGLQPVLTALLAGPYLGERLNSRQWMGIALGFSGVALVVWDKLGPMDGQLAGALANIIGLVGITAGTLYQKRHGGGTNLRWGAAFQLCGAAGLLWILALIFEIGGIVWSGQFVASLVWLILANSMGAFTLLYILIRRGAASKVASLFYLVPPLVAVEAWILFGEALAPVAILGMAITAGGVALVTKSAD